MKFIENDDLFYLRIKKMSLKKLSPRVYPKKIYIRNLKSKKESVKNMSHHWQSTVKMNYKSSFDREKGCDNPNKFKSYIDSHINYISRDGAGKGEDKPTLFYEGGEIERKEFKLLFSEIQKEKRIFKFVLSPENPKVDLIEHTKKCVAYLENQHGLELNWQASIHNNTTHPHVHLLIRGVDKKKKQVRFKKEIIKQGLRDFSEKEIKINYGQKTDFQMVRDLDQQIFSNYITRIDRIIEHKIQKEAESKEPFIDFIPSTRFEYERLQRLSFLGLAFSDYTGKNRNIKCFKIRKNFISELRKNQTAIDRTKNKQKEQKVELSTNYKLLQSKIENIRSL